MNMTKKTKYGFSLMEACVVMLVASIFFVVMANVIPRKVTVKSMAEAHGRFECYYNGNNLMQEAFNGGASEYGGARNASTMGGGSGTIPGVANNRKYCKFNSNRYAKYYIFNIVGAGGRGGASIGGNAGKFASSFTPAFTGAYLLFPGKYDTNNTTNTNTYVVREDLTRGNSVIMSAAGGSEGGSILTASLDDINDCMFTNVTKVERFDCGRTPSCRFSDNKIYVKHCVNQEVVYEAHFKLNDTNARECLNSVTWGLKGKLLKGSNYNSTQLISLRNSGLNVNALARCDYNSLASNPWIKFNEQSGEFEYPDVHMPYVQNKQLPHMASGRNWYPNIADEKSPSLYTMLLYKNVEASESGADSHMTTMANAFGFSDGLKASSGKGGDKGRGAGQDGSVVVTW